MLDDVCVKLLSETKTSGWMSLSEFHGILQNCLRDDVEVERVMDFLKKYLVDVDVGRNVFRLSNWACELFKDRCGCL
jgi:hypothetical protein